MLLFSIAFSITLPTIPEEFVVSMGVNFIQKAKRERSNKLRKTKIELSGTNDYFANFICLYKQRLVMDLPILGLINFLYRKLNIFIGF